MGGGGLVGGIGGLVGIKSAEEKAAERASNRAVQSAQETRADVKRIGKEMLEFNQGILDEWESRFGSMESNLHDYYSTLDPAKFATTSKTSLTSHIDKQINQISETLSAQGIQTSGMKSQALKEAAFTKAEGSAQIDINAPEQVNQMKQQWLASNAQEKANAVQGINASYGNQMQGNISTGNAVANTYQNQSAMYAGIAAQNRATALDLGKQAGEMAMGYGFSKLD